MQLRQIGTALVGAVLTSATLMGGALAADLGNYPAPFATDDGVQSTIVVGSQGTDAAGIAKDIVGAINIGAALAQIGGTVTGGTTAVSTVVGAKSDDVAIGTAVSATLGTGPFKDNKLAGLLDTKISFDDGIKTRTLDVHEEVAITTDLKIMSSADDKDFGSDIVLSTDAKDSVVYKYVLETDTDFNASKVTTDYPLEITVLGKKLKITDIDTATNELTVSEGLEAAMGMDTTLEIDGKTLEVTAIGQDTVAFKVGADTAFVNKDQTKEIGNSGIKVKVDNILYTDDADSRQILVTAGTSTTDTIQDADPMEMFGEPDEESDAVWVWEIDAQTNSLTIGAEHNQVYDEPDEDVVTVGNALTLPNDYGTVSLDVLTVSDYGTYELAFDEVDYTVNSTGSTVDIQNNKVLAFIAKDSNDDGFTLVSNLVTEESDYVYIEADGTIAFKNSDNKIQESDASTFNITFEDTVMTVEITNITTDYFINITGADALGNIIQVDVGSTWDLLGTAEGDGEGSDVKIDGVNYGAEEEDARTTYGVIVEDPEANADSDKVILAIPSEQVKATVTISGPGSSVSTTTATEGGYTPAALPATGIAKVDSEAEAAKSGNLILVGGPAVNSLVAELAAADKTRTAEGWRAETDGVRDYADTALIQAVDDAFTSGKTALVVAGYSSEDTANAAYVLQNYAKFAEQFADKAEVTVTGTTTDAVQ
ncbi:MAG: hypothetical protein KAR51_01640 [Candidatus Aenigmarchaeota archaeon]|nr:hypothetical protein [Candidatus Aenigmarchaeota archaeon]